jgi:hypothetical protein
MPTDKHDKYKADAQEEAREEFQNLQLNLYGMTVPLFSGPVSKPLQAKVGELLDNIFSRENLLFLQAIYELSLKEDPRKDFDNIIKNFIASGSPNEINIPADMAKKILTRSKNNTLSLEDFKDAVKETCKLINTNLSQLKQRDRNAVTELSIQQNLRELIQELNEAKAALLISAKKNSNLNPSVQSLALAIADLKNLRIKDDHYLDKFTSIMRQMTQEQDDLSRSIALKGSRDQSLVTWVRDIGTKLMEQLGEKVLEEKNDTKVLPKLKSTKQEVSPTTLPSKVGQSILSIFSHPEKESKDNKGTALAQSRGGLLPPLKRTK